MRTTSHLVFGAVLLLSLVACQSGPKVQSNAIGSSQYDFSLYFTSARQLEWNVCGCTLVMLGGIDREANIVRSWKKEHDRPSLYVSGGTTFVPEDKFEPNKTAFYLNKAKRLVSMLNELELEVLSPAAADMVYGTAALKSLEARAKFPFVSSNIVDKKTGKLAFQPFYEKKIDGRSVTVIGLTSNTTRVNLDQESVQIKEPVQAVSDLIRTLPKNNSLIVLVSALSDSDRKRVLDKFPQIRVVLDARRHQTDRAVSLLDSGLLYANAKDSGRSIVRIDLELNPMLWHFYNEEEHDHQLGQIKHLKERIQELDENIKKAKRKKQKRAIANVKQGIERTLRTIESLYVKSPENAMHYGYELMLVEEKWAEPKNALTRSIQSYKESLREQAIEEAK